MATIDNNEKIYIELISGDEYSDLSAAVAHVDTTKNSSESLIFIEAIKITKE